MYIGRLRRDGGKGACPFLDESQNRGVPADFPSTRVKGLERMRAVPVRPYLLSCVVWCLSLGHARAETLNIPVGADPIDMLEGQVLCEAIPKPFRSRRRRSLIVAPRNPKAAGKSVRVRVAATRQACEQTKDFLELVATGPWPEVDPASIALSPDEGRLDAQGQHLAGTQVYFRGAKKDWLDACYQPSPTEGGERCSWTVSRHSSGDPDGNQVAFLPRGAHMVEQARFYDARGQRVMLEARFHKPAHIYLQRLLPVDASVDISSGSGELELIHPEAVGTVSCAPLSCELRNGRVFVLAAAQPVETIKATLRLRPRVMIQVGEQFDSEQTADVLITTCPMEIVSGEPFRGTESAGVVLKLEGLCASEASSLQFLRGRREVVVSRTVHGEDGTYVYLRIGRIEAESLTITAMRRRNVAVAVARSVTRAAPQIRAALEVPGFPNVDFIPTNRWATVHVVLLGAEAHAVALPIEGVYEARYDAVRSYVRGDPHAAGMTPLKFAIRNPHLPGPLAQVDLAVVPDLLLRGVREANIPAPLHAGAKAERPLIEVLCGGDAPNGPIRLKVGTTENLAFRLRDTCRVIFHRDRLEAKYGTQRVRFEMDVYAVDGSRRSDAHVAETLTLRHGTERRVAYVHGVINPFDRVVVRVRHEADETHYMGASEIRTGAPAAKWTAIFGAARARLYATTAFPTGLYRLSTRAQSGLLSLNFGLLSRLTWLDDEGNEGFLGLEGGLVVIGLGNAVTGSGDELTQAGAVIGLGLSVPFANRASSAQASINVHAWLEVDLTNNDETADAGRLAFIFGPSISIGNLGTNL